MSFFPYSSGFVFLGGSFYVAGGDVILQDSQQLVIGANDIIEGQALERSTDHRQQAIGWQGSSGGGVPGPVRSNREAARFSPYDPSLRRQHQSLQSYGSHGLYPPEYAITANRNQSWYNANGWEAPQTVPRVGFSQHGAENPSEPPVTSLESYMSLFGLGDMQPEGSSSDASVQARLSENVHADAPRPGTYTTPTTIHNGAFISGNVNNTLRTGELDMSSDNVWTAYSSSQSSQGSVYYIEVRRQKHRTTLQRAVCSRDATPKLESKCRKHCANADYALGARPCRSREIRDHENSGGEIGERRASGGAFFFKRGHPTRGNAKALFVTIALQLAVNSPQLKLRISRAAEENPTLVGRSIRIQLEELILKPCSNLRSSPWTIIVDGLDECEGHHIQQEILRVVRDAVKQPTALRFVIASRPEAHIRELLDEVSFRGLYRKFDVESSSKDVHTYLVAEFSRIHHEHSTMAAVPSPWPSPEVIEHLLCKSSGYFIYATTVIKFVDDKNFRPTHRLAAIKNLTGTSFQSPFGALDELYTQILLSNHEQQHLLPILRFIDNFGESLKPSHIDSLLQLESGDTTLSLRGLHSVVKFDSKADNWTAAPYFIHASFSDFLRDRSRAGNFFIDELAGLLELVRSVLTELDYMYEDPMKNLQFDLDGMCVHIGDGAGSIDRLQEIMCGREAGCLLVPNSPISRIGSLVRGDELRLRPVH
ncbi:hypothetical protein B0H19DRAFT_1261243 [Mycena capillaripes]|nr:hypothetical protein B0H19DRAFT_1261243 [Mycena capillaripes]